MLHRGVCFEQRRIKGSGETEIFYEESIYSHRRRVYIFNKKKKNQIKKKNDDVENCGVSKVFFFIYIYIDNNT